MQNALQVTIYQQTHCERVEERVGALYVYGYRRRIVNIWTSEYSKLCIVSYIDDEHAHQHGIDRDMNLSSYNVDLSLYKSSIAHDIVDKFNAVVSCVHESPAERIYVVCDF